MRIGACTVRTALASLAILVVLSACSSESGVSGLDPGGPVTLQSVSPANGLTGVSVTMPMAMRFSSPLGAGMERYMAVHEGSVTGALVSGHWSWSTDHRTVTFTPDSPLKPRTTYLIHLGGGMRSASGDMMDYSTCVGLGGRAVPSAMMGGVGGGMMGDGWKGSGGGYGMTFTFTTA